MKILSIICIAVLMVTAYPTISLAQIPDKAEDISPLLVGESLPEITLKDINGKAVGLMNVFGEKPTVLVFYRGGWCPYCNLQLAGLAQIESEIIALGYQIVAISPDKYQDLSSTEEKNNLKYSLLSDENAELLKAVGIAFKSSTKGILPVPTVMVVDKSGVIKFEHINPNYKERISSSLLLGVLKNLD